MKTKNRSYCTIRRQRVTAEGVIREQWWNGTRWIEFDEGEPKVWRYAASAHKVGEKLASIPSIWVIWQDYHSSEGVKSEKKYG